MPIVPFRGVYCIWTYQVPLDLNLSVIIELLHLEQIDEEFRSWPHGSEGQPWKFERPVSSSIRKTNTKKEKSSVCLASVVQCCFTCSTQCHRNYLDVQICCFTFPLVQGQVYRGHDWVTIWRRNIDSVDPMLGDHPSHLQSQSGPAETWCLLDRPRTLADLPPVNSLLLTRICVL